MRRACEFRHELIEQCVILGANFFIEPLGQLFEERCASPEKSCVEERSARSVVFLCNVQTLT